MKLQRMLVFVTLLITILLGACGPAKIALVPTPTSLPTPTSAPTSIPGWNKFTATGIEIWFPGSWEGGNLENDLDVIVGKLRSLGSEYEQFAKMIEANPNVFAMWVYDTDFGNTGYMTNVNIVKEEVVSVITLDKYAEAIKGQLPSSMTITDKKNITLNQRDALRLEVTMDISGATAKEVLYILKNENTIWTITFATSADEFATRVPVFEQIANTFTIQE